MTDDHPDRLYKSDRLNYIVGRMRLQQNINPTMLAAELNVSERTIYRDLRNLEKDNALKKRYSRREGRYMLETEIKLPPLSLTPLEALALYRAAANPALASDNFYAGDLRAALDKLTRTLAPDTPRERAAEPPEFVVGYAVVGVPEPQTPPDIYRPTTELIRRAMNSNRKLRFHYWYGGSNHADEVVVAPFDLRPVDGDWHLLAQAERGAEARIYKVSRMRGAEILEDGFRYPRRFSADAAFMRATEKMDATDTEIVVTARFTAVAAPIVRDSHGPRLLDVHENADGSIVCTLQATGARDILWWILAFGADAEVLGPAFLRAQCAQIARSMAELYLNSIRSAT